MGSIKIDPQKMKSSFTASPQAAFAEMMGANKNDIQQISIESLIPYPDQPFKPYLQDKLLELAEDIEQNGILSPIIVRPFEGAYQILAGHNRAKAAKLAGLEVASCIVKDVSDDEAKLILVNTNLNQRQELLHSEKAFAYQMQLEALKHQGKRAQSTCAQIEHKLKSVDMVAQNSSETRAQIQRYIRLTYLRSFLLDMVDIGTLPMIAGVELSYITEQQQQMVYDLITAEEKKLDIKRAQAIRELARSGELTEGSLYKLFYKPTSMPKSYFKLPVKKLSGYLPADITENEAEAYILKALEYYRENGSP